MAKNNIYFQTVLSKSSKEQIGKEYNLASNDEILMAAWVFGEERSVFDRYGFVITKDGLGWHYPAIAETSEKGSENKERGPRNLNFIEKNNVTFLGTEVRSSEVAARTDGKSEIQLIISGTVYSFAFHSRIKQEKVIALERAIAAYFSDCLDLTVYKKFDASYSFSITVLSVRDFFIEIYETIKSKFSKFKSQINKGAQKLKSAETKDKTVSAVNKVGAFFRHIIDFATDLMLMFAVLIFVKPQLLQKDFLSGISAKFSGLSFSIFCYDYSEPLPQEIIDKRNFIFIILAALFLILKIFISLSCQKNRKAVTGILLIMLVADFLLISDKFFIFAIFMILLLIAMQFSMGFSGKTVRIKSVLFTFTCIIGYLVLHIALYENFAELLGALINTLALPVRWR